MPATVSLPIAIIGMGCRFPGAPDLRAYEQLLLEGRYAIDELPADRLDPVRQFDPDPAAWAKSYSRLAGLIDESVRDAAAFALEPSALAVADTIQRCTLEVARATFEHAGIDPFSLSGRDVGVLLGHSRCSQKEIDFAFSVSVEALLAELNDLAAWNGLSPAIRERARREVVEKVHRLYPPPPPGGPAAFRASGTSELVARAMGLRGAQLVVDSACASSLAALDMAVQALSQRRVSLALAGGAALTTAQIMILFSQARALSPDGSFPFDARANGFVAADGIGMLLLARLDDAVAAGHRIHGVVRGIGASNDGHGKGLWAPSTSGQVLAIRNAFARSGVDPSSVGYIEAHGTSTALGDATEIETLTTFFRPHFNDGRKLPVGSVKSNIGHTRAAAGVAGLLKVLLAFEREVIPPSIQYREPNPHIDWNATPLTLATDTVPWTRGERPRVAGVDSFGIGGLNYHVLLEEAPSARRCEELLATSRRTVPEAPRSTPQDQQIEPVAVVGIGCIVPGARGAAELWRNLSEGRSAIGTIPADRWDPAIYSPDSGPDAFRPNSVLAGAIRDFNPDWKRYRMPPNMVKNTDPMQLMLLECALDALADGGIDVTKIDRERVGVFVGTPLGSDFVTQIGLAIRAPEAGDHVERAARDSGAGEDEARRAGAALAERLRARLPQITEDATGSAFSSPTASRIARVLDLHGPAGAIDSAFASSLVALEVACEALRSGAVDLVLWAGADLSLGIDRFVDAARRGLTGPGNRTTPFEQADGGMVLGEGVAVCVLKRAGDAAAEGNRTYALVQGVGTASGFAGAENGHAERALRDAIERAHATAPVDPDAIAFAEALPTGGLDSDAALVGAMRESLRLDARSAPLPVGSIAANIGHAQGAAGALSVVKAALALHHGQLAPTPGTRPPAPSLGQAMEICRELRPLRGTVATVTQFSPDGTSAHVVLAAEPRRHSQGDRGSESDSVAGGAREPVVIRGSDRHALRQRLESLRRTSDLAPGTILGTGPVAVGIRPGDAARLDAASRALAAPSASVTLAASGVALTDYPLPHDTCFLFPGQGSQYAGMLQDVARAYPAAARRLAEVDDALRGCGEVPLSEVLWTRTELLGEVLWTQMAVLGGDLMMLEVALIHGLRPRMVTGHSYGDYPALVAAGAWTLEQAVQTTVARCRAIVESNRPGGMVAVFTDRARVEQLLENLDGYAAASNVNAPDEVIVSGEERTLDALLARCEAAGVNARRLPVPRPFHCELMRPAADLAAGTIDAVPFVQPAIRFLSSTGAKFIDDPAAIRRALIDQFTVPVDFIAQIEAAYAAGCRRFVEIGPGNLLSKLATRILRGRPALVVPLNDRKMPGIDAIESALAVLRAHDSEIAELPAAGRQAHTAATNRAPGEVRFFDVTSLRGTRTRAARTLLAPVRIESTAAPEVTVPPAERDEIETRLVQLVCEQSGYPAELIDVDADLEADLGIDTVKQAQLLGEIRTIYDLPTDEAMAIRDLPTLRKLAEYVRRGAGGPAARSGQAPSPASPSSRVSAIAERLVALVCEQSGYPRDLVDLDADLEADLGIDTVKQAQLLGEIRTVYDLPTDEAMAIRDLPTLRKLVAYVDGALGSGSEAPPVVPASEAPVEAKPGGRTPVAPARELDLPALEASPSAFERFVFRSEQRDAVPSASGAYRPERMAVIGSGSDARAIRDELAARGTAVEVLDLDSGDDLTARWESILASGPLPDVCLVAGTGDPAAARTATRIGWLVDEWQSLRETHVAVPYRLMQLWLRRAQESGSHPTLVAMTRLGGALGAWNSVSAQPLSGALAGLARAVRREFPALQVRLVDVEAGLQNVAAARTLLAELDSAGDDSEAGYVAGVRHVVRVVPAPARLDALRLEDLRAFNYVLLTGGARGITAEIAIRLASAGVRRLHLLGSTPLPPEVESWRTLDAAGLDALRQKVLRQLRAERGSVSPVEWQAACEPIEKAIEIDRNLRRIDDAGAQVTYHAVDVADRAQLAAALDRIRRSDGPVEAMVHGAGYQVSRGFLSKNDSDLAATLRPKVDGCLNLIRLTEADPVKLFVAFGSVAGRFGGTGQADYSLASELLARIVATYAVERPGVRALTIDWPAWDGVGMAVHPRTRHMLENRGVSFLPVDEGCAHFLRELLSGPPEIEVTVGSGIARLDPQGMVSEEELTRWRSTEAQAATLPLCDAVIPEHGGLYVECLLDADRDPFLTQHRQGNTAITPAVVFLELLAETVRVATGTTPRLLQNVQIHHGVKLAHTRRLPLRGHARVGGAGAELELRANHLGLRSHLLAADRLCVSGTARFGDVVERSRPLSIDERPGAPEPAVYQENRRGIKGPEGWVHGSPFRSLMELAVSDGPVHWGRVRALDPVALRPRRRAEWLVPAPAIDGCLSLCVAVVRQKQQTDGLPSGFGQVWLGRPAAPDEDCIAVVRELGERGRDLLFDFTLFGADGAALLVVEDFALRTFHRFEADGVGGAEV